MLADYADLATAFLLVVVVPSVIGELAFTVWLLLRGGTRPPGTLRAPRDGRTPERDAHAVARRTPSA